MTEPRESLAAIVALLIAALAILGVVFGFRDTRAISDMPGRVVVCGSGDYKLPIGPGDEIIWHYDEERRCVDLSVRVK